MFTQVEAFYRPATVAEALRLLDRGKGQARIVAGGTDLVVESGPTVRYLIDITRAGLSYIRRKDSMWLVGATTTLAELEESTAIRGLANGLLAVAAATCGSVQNRNLATVGGNLMHGSPAADLVPPLLVLDASVVIARSGTRHRMHLSDYLQRNRGNGQGRSLLTEISIPEPPRGTRRGWSFQKFGRTELDIALVNAAAGLQLDSRGRVKWARLALGAVAETPFRLSSIEQFVAGQEFGPGLIAEVGEQVIREVQPISDVRASAQLRRELSRAMAGRALEECAAQAGWSL